MGPYEVAVHQKNTTSIKINPWLSQFYGRRTDTLNEPVLDTLHSLLLNFGSIQTGLRSLNLSVRGLMSQPTTDLQFLL